MVKILEGKLVLFALLTSVFNDKLSFVQTRDLLEENLHVHQRKSVKEENLETVNVTARKDFSSRGLMDQVY